MPGARLEVRLRLKRYGAAAASRSSGWPLRSASRKAGLASARRSGETAVLGPVSFAAGPGEVLALFGPSGTGKSTLLRIVLGLDRAFEGSIACPPGPAGVVFQEPRLAPWLSVAANLRLVAPALDEAGVAALLAPLGLAGSEGVRPGALSLGMQRRVALARALAIDPSWLVLDEPFASLDPGLAATLGAIVAARARDAGAIVLLATHELDQALALATRILVLSGRPATLVADVAVPEGGRAGLRADLLDRFAFLGGAGREAGPG